MEKSASRTRHLRNVFAFPVVVHQSEDRDDTEKFMRPFLALRQVDEHMANMLRKMAIDYNDHRRLGAGMRYGAWQESAKRKNLNMKRLPGERANGFD